MEVIAIEQQGDTHGLCQSIGGTITKVQPRLGIALAIAIKRGGGMHLNRIKRYDFNFIIREQPPKLVYHCLVVSRLPNVCGFIGVNGRNNAAFINC